MDGVEIIGIVQQVYCYDGVGLVVDCICQCCQVVIQCFGVDIDEFQMQFVLMQWKEGGGLVDGGDDYFIVGYQVQIGVLCIVQGGYYDQIG